MNNNNKLIDIHTHIIPTVDDGSNSIETSRKMLKSMIKDNITDVILTPHVHSNATRKDRDEQIELFHILKEEVKDLNINIHLGSELKYHSNLEIDYENNLMANSNYILMEFSWSTYEDIHYVLQTLQNKGYIPIVAHIERYSYLSKEDYFKIKANGNLIQVNTDALLSLGRPHWNENAKYLLDNKLVDFIASDAHNTTNRPPNLKEVYNNIKTQVEEQYLKDIFYNNALKVLNSKRD